MTYLKFTYPSTCDSLREIDFSGVRFPQSPTFIGNITLPFGCCPLIHHHWFDTFRSVSKIYMNKLISSEQYIYLENVTIRIRFDNNSLDELHLSGYNIPMFELRLILEPNHVKYLDISNNKIKDLSPDFLADFKHLKIIDMSHNKLSVSERFISTFSKIFRNNLKLETARLPHNGIDYLPTKVFEVNTEMKRIDMSSNKFTQIPFEIANLHMLKVLDLSENLIEHLNGWSMHQLDILYKYKQEAKNTSDDKSLNVNLRGNIFSCKCHSLDFIKWFIHSPVFEDSHQLYYCTVDGKHVPMNMGAIEAAQYDCDKPKRKIRRLLLIVLLPCVSTGTLVIMAIVLFNRYKKKKKLLRIREQVYLIQENQSDYRFPVFLSYASEDSGFVEPNILQPLDTQLKTLTDCDRNLVAIGDRYFRLGRSIFAEIIRMLEDCAVIVLVLSKNYCYSDYCKHEIEQARLMRKPIVIIMKEFVDEGDMNGVIKETFKHFTRATFRFDEEGFRLDQEWEYICQSIIQLL